MQNMKKRKKSFLQLPQIIGGNEAFKSYVEDNLIYPPEARKKRIEGTVYLSAEIEDTGNIKLIEILRGLDGGCNEEAIRLINNIRFGAVKNKGIRLKTKKQFRIKFQLPVENSVNYELISKSKDKNISLSTKKYSYTIKLE